MNNVRSLPGRPSVRPSFCYQYCEHDILKKYELAQVDYGVRRWYDQLSGSGQRSRSDEAEDWFRGLVEESFSIQSVKQVF